MNTRIMLVRWLVFFAVPLLLPWTVDAGDESPGRGQELGEAPSRGVEPITQSVHPEDRQLLPSPKDLKAVRRDDAAREADDDPKLPLHFDVRLDVPESVRKRLREYAASLCLSVYPNAKPTIVLEDCEASFLQEEYGVRVARARGPEFRFTLKSTGIRLSGSFPHGRVLAMGVDRPPPGVALKNPGHAMGMQEAKRVADDVAARLGEEFLGRATLDMSKSGYSHLDETYYFDWIEKVPKHLQHCGRTVHVEVRNEDGLVTYVRVMSRTERPEVPFERAVANANRAAANSTHGFSADRVFLDVAQYFTKRKLVWCYAVPAVPGGGPRDVTKWDAVTGRVLYSEVLSGGTEERPYRDPDFFAVPTESSVKRDIERMSFFAVEEEQVKAQPRTQPAAAKARSGLPPAEALLPPEVKPNLILATKALELERQGRYRAALQLLQKLRNGDFVIPARTEITGETEDGQFTGEWVDARPIGNRRLAMMRCHLQLGNPREALALAWQTIEAETADDSAFACIVQHSDLQGGLDRVENRLRKLLKKNPKHSGKGCLDYVRVEGDLADGKYPALVDRIRSGSWHRSTESGPGAELKEYVAAALASRSKEALPDLVKVLTPAEQPTWIVYCLGLSGDERAIEPLFNYLVSVSNTWARQETVLALSRFGDKAASYAIAKLDSKKPLVRERAAEVLSACTGDALQKADPGLKRILRALRDLRNHGKDGWVNTSTFLLRAIAATRNHDYLDEVRRIKKEAGSLGAGADWQYVYTLAFLGDTSVVPKLIDGLDGKYHHFARPALEVVTGKSFRTHQEWQEWWEQAHGPAESRRDVADLLKHLKPRIPRGWKVTHVVHGIQAPIGWGRGEGTFLTIENEDDSDIPAVRIAIMDVGYAEKLPEDSGQASAHELPNWQKRRVFVHGEGADWPDVKSDLLIAIKLVNESRYPGFQAAPPRDRSADPIEEVDIDEFLEKLSKTVVTDRASFLKLVKQGKRVFYKGRPVSEKQFNRLTQHNVGSVGDTFTIFIVRLSPRSYPGRGYSIHFEVSNDRRIVDFYWEYPIEPDAASIPLEQLAFFHRHLESQDYIRAIKKGWDIFKKGRKLPPEFFAWFKTCDRGPTKDGDRYCFLEGSYASAWLWIDKDTRMVNSFTGAIQ